MKIMNSLSNYLNFIKEKGRSLSEINPGSNEIALTVNDTLYALNLLEDNQIAILGGDILSEDIHSRLAYVIHSWGYDYHYLNWYCDKMESESQEDYVKRSYTIARESIKTASDIARRLGESCYIVIVI